MNSSSRQIWSHPWGYPEGFIVATGVVLVGTLLQITVGKLNPDLYSYPINVFIGALFVSALLITHFIFKRTKIIKWLSSVYSTIPVIVILLALSIILGFIPQLPITVGEDMLPADFFSSLGWYQMTTSWSFVLICFYLLTIL